MDDQIPRATMVALAALSPAPWNPRTIKDERFENLCRSIEADPEFLNHRPVLAMADGTIYAGNMRYRAAQHLGRIYRLRSRRGRQIRARDPRCQYQIGQLITLRDRPSALSQTD